MIQQAQLPMVQTSSMNDFHLQDMLSLNKIESLAVRKDSKELEEELLTYLDHTKEHFAHEEEMMIEKKFPPYLHHKEEHDKALKNLENMISEFQTSKNPVVVLDYLEKTLIPWFLQHVETLDSVTSMFLENSEEHLKFWENLDWEKRKAYTQSKKDSFTL